MDSGFHTLYARQNTSDGIRTIPPQQNTANIGLFGPFFLGIVASYYLWGIQITQSYYYFVSFRKTDRTWLKASVAAIFLADAFHSVAASQLAYHWMVDGWGDLPALAQNPGWGLNLISMSDGITASIVHFFYAQRIFRLFNAPHNYIWSGIVITLSCVQLVAGIGMGIFMFIENLTLGEFERIKTWACIWLVGAAITDIIITIIMTQKLSRSRTGFKSTDDILSKLIRTTVETGAATAVVQLLDIMFYLIWTLKTYHFVWGLTGPKVYSNSMLAILNARRKSDESSSTTHPESIQIHTVRTVNTMRDYDPPPKPGRPTVRYRNDLQDRVILPPEESVDSSLSSPIKRGNDFLAM